MPATILSPVPLCHAPVSRAGGSVVLNGADPSSFLACVCVRHPSLVALGTGYRCVSRELGHATALHRMERSRTKTKQRLGFASTKGTARIRRQIGSMPSSPVSRPGAGQAGALVCRRRTRGRTWGMHARQSGDLRVDRSTGFTGHHSVENLKEPPVMTGDATDGTQGALARRPACGRRHHRRGNVAGRGGLHAGPKTAGSRPGRLHGRRHPCRRRIRCRRRDRCDRPGTLHRPLSPGSTNRMAPEGQRRAQASQPVQVAGSMTGAKATRCSGAVAGKYRPATRGLGSSPPPWGPPTVHLFDRRTDRPGGRRPGGRDVTDEVTKKGFYKVYSNSTQGKLF